MADHLAGLLLAPTAVAMATLVTEGLTARSPTRRHSRAVRIDLTAGRRRRR
ncbi:hypothetical protein [Streptomyces sp. TRM49041]|uniref:hypothetical protein n=1 Tax=Streptomyces sp. TRM49041 TaxID=2603216 RepID=UPI00292A41E4|nr:hypothetical protein [Streptomyces sp. TRM49041]